MAQTSGGGRVTLTGERPEGAPSGATDLSLSAPSSGMVAGLIVTMAIGLLVVICGFALSRAGKPGALDAFIVGQLLVAVAPGVFLAAVGKLDQATGYLLAACVGAFSFLITQCYSPLVFRFEDEYQHVRTTQSILATHHLFGANPALPISPQYPGMEIITSSLSAVSHLSIYASGTIISGLSHVAMVILLYHLGMRIGLSPRAAAFAVVVFSIGTDYQFFLSYFSYQTFAMPFLIATVILSVKAIDSPNRRSLLLAGSGALGFGFVTIISHHITSYFMMVILGIIALVAAICRDHARLHKAGLIFLVLLAILAVWVLGVAPDTIHYLSQIRGFLVGNGTSSSHGQPAVSLKVARYISSGKFVVSGANPFPVRILSDVSAALLAILIPFGAWRAWKSRLQSRYGLLALCIACLPYYALALIFLYSPGASELIGRGESLVLIPVGLIVAGVLNGWSVPAAVGGRLRRWILSRKLRVVSLICVVGGIVAGGILSTWPPYPGKLPGPYNVSAYDRSTDQRTIALGLWMAKELGGSNNFAADHRESLIVNAISGDQYISKPAGLFESETYTPADGSLVRMNKVKYIIADYRMTQELPADGAYFLNDPLSGYYSKPLPLATLNKFDHIAGISRVFDDGAIVVYGLVGSRYYDR